MYASEIWNFKNVAVQHEEKWTERESRTRQVYTGTDSKGNAQYRTETYYVTETYGPYWKAIDEYGETRTIQKETYALWKKNWGNEKKTGVHKGSSAGFARSITGGIFKSVWPGTREKIYPQSTVHTYKNKIRCSQSILKLKEPTPELIEKYPRPADTDNLDPIVGYGTKFAYDQQLKLRQLNADFGKKYEIHVMLVVFQDQDMGIVDDVLSAWRGTNKNELVMFIGVDGRQVKWADVHSWMDDTTIHAIMRDKIMEEKVLSIDKICADLDKAVPQYWKRKEGADYEYLKVDIHWGWFVMALALSLGCCVGAMIVINKLEDKHSYRRF